MRTVTIVVSISSLYTCSFMSAHSVCLAYAAADDSSPLDALLLYSFCLLLLALLRLIFCKTCTNCFLKLHLFKVFLELKCLGKLKSVRLCAEQTQKMSQQAANAIPLASGFAVAPIDNCPHVNASTVNESLCLDKIKQCGSLMEQPCEVCNDKTENWFCLSCAKVFCSRYVQATITTFV